ncbi:MAG: PKD domain-containing protein, partial [Bacteroidota bacterium]
FALFLIFGQDCFSQKEANNWYFGFQQAVNFATGNPALVPNSAMNADYGSTSLSDSLGNLLFYSNGQVVFDRNNLMMPHGDNLLSNDLATSPCVAFQKPGDQNQYYLFTVSGSTVDKKGPCVNYSIVDMRLNSGSGDIIASKKNIAVPAADSAFQTIGAVKHGSLDAYWLIVRNHGIPNQFLSFLVDATGVNQTPVTSPCTIYYSASSLSQSEIIKISPNGKYVLYASRNQNSGNYGDVELYNFDNITGQLSLALLFNTGERNTGAEFSANSEYLYMSNSHWMPVLMKHDCWITQFDLKKINNVTLFQSSAYVMVHDTLNHMPYGNLLLANNGKIYFVQPKDQGASYISYLGVINYPYLSGAACAIQLNLVHLTMPIIEGLPTFVSSFMVQFDWTGICAGLPIKFRSRFYPPPVSALWNFNDPSSGPDNTSILLNPEHTFNSQGVYSVSVTVVYPNGTSETSTRNVTISTGPAIEIGDTIYICEGDSVQLTPGTGFSEYLWSTGSQNAGINVSDTGIYWVQVRNPGGCPGMDSVRILYYNGVQFNDDSLKISPTTCGGQTGVIKGLQITGQLPLLIQWTASGTPYSNTLDIYHLGVGLYELNVKDGNGCEKTLGSYVINDAGNILIDTAKSTPEYCGNKDGTLSITAISGLDNSLNYFVKRNNDTISQWHDGVFTGLPGGIYYVWVTDSSGCTSVYPSPVMVEVFSAPQILNAGSTPETGTFSDGTITVAGVGTGLTYSLNGATAVNNGYFNNLSAGNYSVKVVNMQGCDTTLYIIVGHLAGIRLQAIAGEGSACLGNVAVLPLLASHFTKVGSFDTQLNYDKTLVSCQQYLRNVNPLLADSLEVILYPGNGALNLKWTGKKQVSLPDSSTMLELSFASVVSGQGQLKWDLAPGISVFRDSLGTILPSDFTPGKVRIYSIPEADLPVPPPVCEGSELLLIPTYHPNSGNGAISYTWSGPAGFTAKDILLYLKPITQANAGSYTLHLSDTNLCTNDYAVTINVVPVPVSGFTADTVYFEEQTRLEATQGYNRYAWSTGDSTYSILVTAEGWYKVQLQTAEGCTSADSVMMLYAFTPLSMPNAFTPDGNLKNDIFRPVTFPEKISSFSMYIYDRWGRLIFFTNT